MTLRLITGEHVARLFIDRADKRNAFNQAMWEKLPELVLQAMADPAVRLLTIESAHPGLFCAGADIAELLANKDDAGWRSANQAAINRAQHVLARAEKPVIAFIDGDCVGGGCGLALAADIRVATPRARLGITPAKLGLVYPLHDTKLLVDLVGPGQAKRLLYTGMLLSADEALRIGLVDELADSPGHLEDLIAANSVHSTTGMKRFVRRVLDGQAEDDAATLAVFADAFTAPDFLEGSSAFVEKRKPAFR
ncbi:MAG: enoyl-CoA hydratase/isomerase family protein [Sphingomonadaceae bacterium]|nr:enoyl-CoA hydratase/isomerase family protein [Sphingomonadaceae bacterium]